MGPEEAQDRVNEIVTQDVEENEEEHKNAKELFNEDEESSEENSFSTLPHPNDFLEEHKNSMAGLVDPIVEELNNAMVAAEDLQEHEEETKIEMNDDELKIVVKSGASSLAATAAALIACSY